MSNDMESMYGQLLIYARNFLAELELVRCLWDSAEAARNDLQTCIKRIEAELPAKEKPPACTDRTVTDGATCSHCQPSGGPGFAGVQAKPDPCDACNAAGRPESCQGCPYGMQPPSTPALVYVDGGCRRNGKPHASMYGSMAFTNVLGMDKTPRRFELGHGTSNEAEYKSLLAAMVMAEDQKLERVEFRTDSQLVVGQVTLGWKCKHKHLEKLAIRVMQYLDRHPGWALATVPRQEVVAVLGH